VILVATAAATWGPIDGVHLTRAGGDRLAAEVLDVVEARAGLRSEAATRPAQG
jgi:lysophospholipase L1-like esterase